MAEGVNKVMLLGSLGSDAELRYGQNGQPVLKFRLATNESWVDKDGARKERTEWHSAVLFGKRGEALSKYLTKGSTVFVEGSLRTSSWEGKDGQKRYKTEVNVTNVIFAGGKGGGGGGYGSGHREPETEGYGPAPDAGGFDDQDEIPFGRRPTLSRGVGAGEEGATERDWKERVGNGFIR